MNKLYVLPVLLVLAASYFFYATPTPAQSSATTLADAAPLKVQAKPANSMALKVNQQATGKVSGEVRYNQQVALPDSALITVQLLDITRSDVSAPVVGEQTVQSAGRQVPIPFELNYDPTSINPNSTYNLFARITVDGNLIYASTSPCLVVTKGRPTSVKIVLSATTGGDSNHITGKLTYPDQLQLPANAMVTVQLVDISRPESPAIVRGEHSMQTNGQQIPIAYDIKYNANTIRRADYYAVRATIIVDGKVWFNTTQNYRVLTHSRSKKANLTLSKVNP